MVNIYEVKKRTVLENGDLALQTTSVVLSPTDGTDAIESGAEYWAAEMCKFAAAHGDVVVTTLTEVLSEAPVVEDSVPEKETAPIEIELDTEVEAVPAEPVAVAPVEEPVIEPVVETPVAAVEEAVPAEPVVPVEEPVDTPIAEPTSTSSFDDEPYYDIDEVEAVPAEPVAVAPAEEPVVETPVTPIKEVEAVSEVEEATEAEAVAETDNDDDTPDPAEYVYDMLQRVESANPAVKIITIERLSEATGVPADFISAGIKALSETGTVVGVDGMYMLPEFTDAE